MKSFNSLNRNLSCLIICLSIFSSISWSQPATPTQLTVIPRYTSPIVIVVQWQDNSNNEDGFRIERREEGTTGWVFWITVPSSVGTGQREWVDNSATPDKNWEYHICATSSTLGNSTYTDVSHGTSPNQVWPINDGDHTILHTYGTPLNFGGNRYFHNGIDIGAGGKQVDASRGGIVTRVDNLAGGQLWLNVDFGVLPEVDVYAHTIVDATWGAGDFIAPGERIGTVSTVHFNMAPEANHVHWGDGHRHNLIPFTINADRDPNMTAPVVTDINNDGKDFIVVSAAANDHTNPREPAWGDVDFIVDAYDDMASGTNLMAAPFTIGYWIQSLVSGGDNVRNSISPYELIKFDFRLHDPQAAHPLENAVVYWNLNADIQGINTWQTCLSWIVTNTRGTDGATANVDANQFWRTNARKPTLVEPNGSDAQVARENQEARFPDGTYNVHVVLEDLVNKTDVVRPVIVDNSRPYVKRVKVSSGIQPVYLAQWVWNTNTAQLELQPASFDAAAAFSALRTQDINIEVEFSEPMQTASIISITPLGVTPPTLASAQMPSEKSVWKGVVSNLDIADDGSDDGIHMITFDGKDLAGNSLLQIHDRNPIGPDNHNRDAAGNIQGTVGTDNIHGFKIGPLSGVIPIAAIFMKQGSSDPISPTINEKVASLQQALNTYFSEISYSNISFSVMGYGWFQLSHPPSWYFTTPQTPLVDLVQEAISSAEANGVDLNSSNYILVVTDDSDPLHGEWSTNGGWPYKVASAPGWRLLAGGAMKLVSSDARETNLVGRWVGLIDLFEYPYVSTPRAFVGPWSHMSDRDNMVDVMGWEKWRAGWLDETGNATGKTLTRILKPAYTSPIINQTHRLLPLDKNNNGKKIVAIEAGDRLHYTVEYRKRQNLDAALPDEGVLIVKANDYVKQGEGAAIIQESNVTAGNLTDATFTLNSARKTFNDLGSGINVEVTSMTQDQADIKINYQVPATQNDVYVTPHDDRWVTEDIWIDAPDLAGHFETNPLTVKDANEKPVIGQVNKVYGRVRNKGHADATNFEIRLGINTPWGPDGPWVTLRVEIVALIQGQDHMSDDYYIISGDWTPTSGEHSCVQLTVTGVANDINTENNWTQENISEFVTSPGSPYAPVISIFRVENPYNETLPVFFNVDGIPASWSYSLIPERLVIPSKGVGNAQVIIQPNPSAPICSNEQITISAYVPQVDALNKLGAITLQIGLKNKGSIDLKSWIDCNGNNKKEIKSPQSAEVVNSNFRNCVIRTQGCTDPRMPNTQIAVVYTAPDGTKAVHYVTTDENGCYVDMISAEISGEWQTQAVLPEADCRAGFQTTPQTIVNPGQGLGPWRYFIAFGPNFPLAQFNNNYDPGFSLNAGVERLIRPNTYLAFIAGYHKFYGQSLNQHFIQTSVNARYIYKDMSKYYAFINAGTGTYKPLYGHVSMGFNIGTGITWKLTSKLGIDLNTDLHYLNINSSRYSKATFLDIQLGIVWSN